MATMPDNEVFVTLGVDTHKDTHVAVALDQLGRWLDAIEIPTTSAGYAQLLDWASDLGTVDRVGIEGTGSHGAGLCRWLTSRGLIVLEVERPDRRLRRNRGKSDTIDAESAARKVLSGEATVSPKSQDGNVERIRILRLTRRSAVVAQGQASNRIHALIATAPDQLRDRLRDLTTRKRVAMAAKFRPDQQPDSVLVTTKLALKKLARRFLDLDAEIKELSRQLDQLVEATAPRLVARRGIGTHTAATLLVTAGDNPQRLRSEGSFAALTGTSPLEASSGPRIRHRLNRGGDRNANAALHMIAVNRLANGHEPTRAYVRKRTGGDKADLDTLRRIKRYIAREVYPFLRRWSPTVRRQCHKRLDGYRRFGCGSGDRARCEEVAPGSLQLPLGLNGPGNIEKNATSRGIVPPVLDVRDQEARPLDVEQLHLPEAGLRHLSEQFVREVEVRGREQIAHRAPEDARAHRLESDLQHLGLMKPVHADQQIHQRCEPGDACGEQPTAGT